MMQATVSSVAFAVLFAGGIGAAEPADNACHKTSTAAQTACEADGKDNRWIGVGSCFNLADAAARQQCIADAKDAQTEQGQLCRDQFDARESLCGALGQAPYDPVIDPAHFLSPQAVAASPNPRFPLVPGMQWNYTSSVGEKDTVIVTDKTRVILGVTTIEVHDVVADDTGHTLEDTLDWFATSSVKIFPLGR
jgi:hypothetical protein